VSGLETQAILVCALAAAGVFLAIQTRRLRQARFEAAASRAALQEMEIIYNQAPLGLTVLDRELRYRRTNRMLADQNGLTVEAHLGKRIREIVPEVAAVAEPMFREVMRTGVPLVGLEFQGATAAHPGEVRDFRESVYPVRDRHGDIVGVSVAVEDITERKRLMTALHASERRERLRASELQTVMDATPAAIFIAHDRACMNVSTNAEGARLLQLDQGINPSLSAPGRLPFRIYAGGMGQSPDELPLQVAAASGEEVRGRELEARFDNGDVLHMLMHAVPLRGHDGEVIGSAAAFVDITAQRSAAQELERQARHKDEFLAVLAHELRNPLAAIQTGLELLRLQGGDGARQARTQDIMQRQMAHVVRLIDDLLDVARISSGKLELKLDTAGVREIVEAAVELSRGEIERAGHRFHAEFPPAPLYLHADRVRLAEVICNLLHNAAKYTPAGGDLKLSVRLEEGQAVLRVADNGMGIARESLAHVFTMFVQAERARARRQGGLGVGLALARRIVELHGGTIAAESDGPGKGSTFTVRLAAVQGTATGPDQDAGERPPAHAPLRILVLDDNVDAASTLGALLEAHGHSVRLAFTGTEALDLLAAAAADIAILDIGLPDISGHEVARRIRERWPERGIFLVALSGWGSAADRQQSEQAGIDVHLTKPATLAAIEEVIVACRASYASGAAAEPFAAR
jgi:PAS domain S-box-containing protein